MRKRKKNLFKIPNVKKINGEAKKVPEKTEET